MSGEPGAAWAKEIADRAEEAEQREREGEEALTRKETPEERRVRLDAIEAATRDPEKVTRAKAVVEARLEKAAETRAAVGSSKVAELRARLAAATAEAELRKQAQTKMAAAKSKELDLRQKRGEPFGSAKYARRAIEKNADAPVFDEKRLQQFETQGYVGQTSVRAVLEARQSVAEAKTAAAEYPDDQNIAELLNEARATFRESQKTIRRELDASALKGQIEYDEFFSEHKPAPPDWQTSPLYDAIMEEAGEMNRAMDARIKREEEERVRLAEQKEAFAKQEAESALRRVEREFANAVGKFKEFMGTSKDQAGVIDRVIELIKALGNDQKKQREYAMGLRLIRREIVERALERGEKKQWVPRPAEVNPFARRQEVQEGLHTDLEALRGKAYGKLLNGDRVQRALLQAEACGDLFGKKFDQSGNMTFIWAVFDSPEGRMWVQGEVEKINLAEVQRAAQPPRPARRPEPRPQRREARSQQQQPATPPPEEPSHRGRGGKSLEEFRREQERKAREAREAREEAPKE